MTDLIADCLRARGVRFFHGHLDQEYFFLLDHRRPGSAGPRPSKLHVHLERGGVRGDEVTVTAIPDRYYPADERDRLGVLAARWTAHPAGVALTVQPSIDPGLVGVAVSAVDRPGDAAELTALIDRTIAAALELTGRMWWSAAPDSEPGLRDAG